MQRKSLRVLEVENGYVVESLVPAGVVMVAKTPEEVVFAVKAMLLVDTETPAEGGA